MTDPLIRELLDRSELAALVARHSLWIDEGRFDESDRLFTDDVTVTAPRGQATGIPALIELADSGHHQYTRTLHSKADLVIEITGDTATVRANDIAVFITGDSSAAIAAGIHRYHARRTPDGWRFDRLDIEPIALTADVDRIL